MACSSQSSCLRYKMRTLGRWILSHQWGKFIPKSLANWTGFFFSYLGFVNKWSQNTKYRETTEQLEKKSGRVIHLEIKTFPIPTQRSPWETAVAIALAAGPYGNFFGPRNFSEDCPEPAGVDGNARRTNWKLMGLTLLISSLILSVGSWTWKSINAKLSAYTPYYSFSIIAPNQTSTSGQPTTVPKVGWYHACVSTRITFHLYKTQLKFVATMGSWITQPNSAKLNLPCSNLTLRWDPLQRSCSQQPGVRDRWRGYPFQGIHVAMIAFFTKPSLETTILTHNWLNFIFQSLLSNPKRCVKDPNVI